MTRLVALVFAAVITAAILGLMGYALPSG